MVVITLLIITVLLAMVICFRNVLNCNSGFEASVSFVAFVALMLWLPILVKIFNALGAQTYG